MAEVYEEMKGKKIRSSKKFYALAVVIVILVGVIGLLLYTTYGGVPFWEKITTPDQAANTLSELGNDIGGIQEDLRDMEDLL